MPLTQSMPANDVVTFAADPENAEGQEVPDTLTWSASPDGFLALTPAADGRSCSIRGQGIAGTAVVTVSDGHISDTITFTLQDLAAATLGLHFVSGPSA